MKKSKERIEKEQKLKEFGVEFKSNISNADLDKLMEESFSQLERFDFSTDEPTPDEEHIPEDAEEEAPPVEEKELTTQQKMFLLKRCIVTDLHPAETDTASILMSVGNEKYGIVRRVIPFNVPWHIPQIIYNELKRAVIRKTKKVSDSNAVGGVRYENVFVPRFGISDLDPLSDEELKELRVENRKPAKE